MKNLPKILKPVIVSMGAAAQNEGTTIEYSNGYDSLSVTLGEKHGDSYRDYSIITADGEHIEAIFTDSELHEYIEEQLYEPTKKRYSVEDFERICKEKGSFHGIARITFHNFRECYYPGFVLLNAIVDIRERGIHGIKVRYEVIGFEGETIYVMVIAELTAGD